MLGAPPLQSSQHTPPGSESFNGTCRSTSMLCSSRKHQQLLTLNEGWQVTPSTCSLSLKAPMPVYCWCGTPSLTTESHCWDRVEVLALELQVGSLPFLVSSKRQKSCHKLQHGNIKFKYQRSLIYSWLDNSYFYGECVCLINVFIIIIQETLGKTT